MERETHETIRFCQEPSEAYLKLLADCNDDPRSAAGRYALSSRDGTWIPTLDARDARVIVKGMKKIKTDKAKRG